MKIRYWKVVRDLSTDKSRTLLLVLAIAIGVFGIGTILGGYSVLSREMTRNYLGTSPASATIELNDSISAALTDSVKTLPGIKTTERCGTISARMQIGDKWYPLLLFVIDDFATKKLNTIKYISGAKIPPAHTMLTERTAFVVMQAKEGESIRIKTPNGVIRTVQLSGTVHDAGLAPAWQEQAGYGYITEETLHWLGEPGGFDELRIQVRDSSGSARHITQTAELVAGWLTNKGYTVRDIEVPPPGRHPHQTQMNAVLMIFITFSIMVLILGSILVATSIAMLMVKQVRQIGVMKTIGGNTMAVTKLYFFMILLLCALALLISIPLSYPAAAGFYSQIAVLLNLEITDRSIPLWVPAFEIGCGILIPMIITAFPVLRAGRIPVKQAMNNYGVAIQKTRSTAGNALWFFNEKFTLSLRNLFRQRVRLITTLGLLAAGGAVFMTALNVREAWNANLNKIFTQRLYDEEIRLQRDVRADTLVAQLQKLKGVKTVEALGYSTTSFIKDHTYEITRTYPDKGHGSFTMQALHFPTVLIHPEMVEGKWLTSDSSNDGVLNQLARSFSDGVHIGDEILLSLNGKPTKWKVIGFCLDVGTPATAYVPQQAFAQQANTIGMTNQLRIAYTNRTRDFTAPINRTVETLLERDNVPVKISMPVWLLQNAIAAHMKVLVNALLAMAVLMALVGLLGLMSTTGMNIMERTREIGVMRAIGAKPATIRNLIVWEGLSIGIMSIVAAFAVALGLSFYLGRFIGTMAFRTPLSLTISWQSLMIWFFIIVAGCYVATLLPARRANKISTLEALAYE